MLSMGSAFTPNYQYGIVIIFSMFVLVPLLNFSQPVLNSLSESAARCSFDKRVQRGQQV